MCADGDVDAVRAMVERTAVDIHESNQGGLTTLHDAARHDHLAMVQYLCERGPDREAWSLREWTQLRRAARNGHLPVVQYLCEQGADKEARDDRYWTDTTALGSSQCG